MSGHFRTLLLGLIFGCFWTSPAAAQSVTSTVGSGDVGTIVSNTGPYSVTGGAQQLNTLFHSFEDFSPGATGVTFDLTTNPTATTVIGRVTGGNSSSIDGQLSLTGGNSPDLFLINPNGITLGGNASLLLPGSFFMSTAESVVFKGNLEFSANNPVGVPLLTVSSPTGINFGATARPITVAQNSLEVNAGESLGLVGGDILLSGSLLSAGGGNISLGSVAPGSQVDFSGSALSMDYANAAGFRDINLTAQAIVDASGPGGGQIQLQGRQINLRENSALRTETSGNQAGKDLILRGAEQITMSAASYDPAIRTLLSTSTLSGSTGNGGNIIIATPFLQVGDRAWIEASVAGSGDGGNITIRAATVEVISSATDDFTFAEIRAGVSSEGTGQGGNFELYGSSLVATDALIGTASSGKGHAGNVRVEVDALSLSEGAQLQTLTFGDGDAGDMVIEASQYVDLLGITSFPIFGLGPASSGLFASAEPGSTGSGGSIRIETPELRVLDGGKIAVNALGTGDGGNITIRDADIVEVSGAVIDFTGGLSGIVSSSESGSSGNAGNIDIESRRLHVFDGGQVFSAALGSGQAGNIDIVATESIEVTGISDDGAFVSRIAATADSSDQAGSVTVTTDQLDVRNGAEINVSNQGSGNAGNLNAITRSILLDNEGSLRAEVNGGGQGNIFLQASDSLVLRHSSNITTNAQSASTGGNITINAPVIVAVSAENSDIFANAVQGDGGNITITTQGLFGLEFREQRTLESDITASSEFGLSGTVKINNLVVNPGAALAELPEAPADADNQIASACAASGGNQFIASGRGGLPVSPSANLSGNRLWSDVREVSAFTSTENVEPDVTATILTHETAQATIADESLVEATRWSRGTDGQVALLANPLDASTRPDLTSCLTQVSEG